MEPTILLRAVDLLLRRRAAVLGILAGLAVLSALAARGLTFGTSPESLLDTSDPALAALRSHEAVLGGYEHTLLLVFRTEDAFAPETLARIRRATAGVRGVPGAAEVRSLTDSGYPLPDFTKAPDAFRREVLANPLLTPFLVARDGRAAALYVRLDPRADREGPRGRAIDGARAAARAAGLDVLAAGVPAVRRAYASYIRHDLLVLPPVVGLILAVLLYLAFRRWLPVLALLATVGLVAAYTIGFLAVTGGRITALTAILPSLIVVLGIATGVHVVAAFEEARRRGAPPRRAARWAMARMALPCALTSLTTATGFSSLVVAGIRDVREFGLYAATGAMFTLLFGVPLTGVALSFVREGPRPPRAGRDALGRGLGRLARALLGRPWLGIGSGALLLLLAATGFPRLDTNSFLLEDVRPGAPIRDATRLVDDELGGVVGFDLVLRTDSSLLAPAPVRYLERLESRLAAIPGVHTAVGPGTLLEQAARVGGGPAAAVAPLLVAGIRARGGGALVGTFLGDDAKLGRITVQTGDVGSDRAARIRERALALAAEGKPEDVSVHAGGLSLVAETVLDRLIREMEKSTLLAFVVIFLLLAALFRSARLGVLAMIPNLLPLACAAGFIGWAGITVRSSIALIFAVALGIAVDDTIHLLFRYRREREKGRAVRTAVRIAIRHTGRPVVLTSAILLAGFLTFLVSNFRATEDFGLVASVTIVTALAGDLLLLPGLLLAGGRRKRQKGGG